MASENLSKKWGTIFMGEHEATVQELEAMHEPMRREQERKDREADYLARVRARATEKAREILGQTYAERQKVLDEARAEAQAILRQAQSEGNALKSAGQSAYREAADEREKAMALRAEAEALRDAAQAEGLKQGMLEAREELRALRAELGQSLGRVLEALQGQRRKLFREWRRELVELVQTAVSAGTGWLLHREEKKILAQLTLQALGLLEDRSNVIIRVNPEDEQTVADLFSAAQERFPGLARWSIKTDPEIQRGGLLAESSSGSVDCRRERFRDLLVNILSHLALPETEQDDAHRRELAEVVAAETARNAFLTPEPGPEEPEEELAQAAGEAMAEEIAEDAPGMPPPEQAEEAPAVPAPEMGEMPQDEDLLPGDLPDEPESVPPQEEAAAFAGPAHEENDSGQGALPDAGGEGPSYEELEAELFPLDGMDEGPGEADPVLAMGGFLDGERQGD